MTDCAADNLAQVWLTVQWLELIHRLNRLSQPPELNSKEGALSREVPFDPNQIIIRAVDFNNLWINST